MSNSISNGNVNSVSSTGTSRRDEIVCLIFYAVLLLITLSTLAATFTNHPLFPLHTESLAWSNAWLLASVIDYYGTCLCFCGVVVASETSWRSAILWVIACCTVKSPACCLYVFLWLTKEGGTLSLKRQNVDGLPTTIQTPPADNDKDSVPDDTTVDSESRLPSPGYSATTMKPQQNHHNDTSRLQQPRYPNGIAQLNQYRYNRGRDYSHGHNKDYERAVIS